MRLEEKVKYQDWGSVKGTSLLMQEGGVIDKTSPSTSQIRWVVTGFCNIIEYKGWDLERWHLLFSVTLKGKKGLLKYFRRLILVKMTVHLKDQNLRAANIFLNKIINKNENCPFKGFI